jgi:hypothetical protein
MYSFISSHIPAKSSFLYSFYNIYIQYLVLFGLKKSTNVVEPGHTNPSNHYPLASLINTWLLTPSSYAELLINIPASIIGIIRYF